MKKSTFKNLMLVLLPILAVGLATTGDSVRVFNPQTGENFVYSYFELMDVGTLQMMTPLAAVLCLVTGILDAIYLGFKKVGCLKWAGICAMLSAIFATLPVMIPGDMVVIPNVLLPLLMLVEAFLASTMSKKPMQEEANAPRLSRH